MRSIDETFISSLLCGKLAPFLKAVKENPNQLSLEIRGGYVSIYYKGGSLLKITRQNRGRYRFNFDSKYCLHKADTSAFEAISKFEPFSAETYAANLPLLMHEMDTWFLAHPKPERDFQHTLLVSNPEIIDVEYQIGKRMRLDMLAVHDGKLMIIENKYGNGAVTGSAGLAKHYKDMCEVLRDKNLYSEMIGSVARISEAKYALGLTERAIREAEITDAEILFLLAGYNERSKTVANETKRMKLSLPVRLLLMNETDSVICWDKTQVLFVK